MISQAAFLYCCMGLPWEDFQHMIQAVIWVSVHAGWLYFGDRHVCYWMFQKESAWLKVNKMALFVAKPMLIKWAGQLCGSLGNDKEIQPLWATFPNQSLLSDLHQTTVTSTQNDIVSPQINTSFYPLQSQSLYLKQTVSSQTSYVYHINLLCIACTCIQM